MIYQVYSKYNYKLHLNQIKKLGRARFRVFGGGTRRGRNWRPPPKFGLTIFFFFYYYYYIFGMRMLHNKAQIWHEREGERERESI